MSSHASTPRPLIRTEFPYAVEKLTQITVPLRDGVKLAGTIWLPKNATMESTVDTKFPAILEYLPYRKADGTSIRDEIRLKYLAGFGYVSVRIDIRGSGNSEGIFDDEYSCQEQADCTEILEWIAEQTWSNGKIVMFGKSWGGFNGLQMAVLQPKYLAGVISAYSTDDRYSDDIHYCGGCIPAGEACPPHPEYQGGIEAKSDLFAVWKDRLDNLVPLDTYWFKHQTRNSYWRHGSICENYSKIECPVLLIGGFADLYTDPVFRMMHKLKCQKRAILGPWGHQWPDQAFPGPQIGILQEFVRWLDHFIKGIQNGVENEPEMSVYQLHPNSSELHSIVPTRKGEWIHIDHMPSYPIEHDQRNGLAENHDNVLEDEKLKYYLSGSCLKSEPILDSASPAKVSLCSPQQTGTASGNWLGWGFLKHPDHSLDQRIDDGRSLCFDSSPLLDDLELFGFPSVQLSLSSNQPNALLCVRLCAIEPETCASILVARGILNLTHFNSHEHPEELEINKIYNIDVTLSGVCVRLSAGYRLRLAVSTAYWPFVWPSPQSATVTIHLNRSSPSVLILPRLAHKCSSKPDFDLPEIAPGLKVITIRDDSISSIRTFDEINEISTLKITKDNGCILYPDGHLFDETSESVYEINEYGPQTARVQIQRNAKT
ncbi:unnamed protein product [Rotaria sordida]|uniref:Xaa-Pro dipeptidyl-peptidase C-terminal domain-containing protein n=1 Tax=Rotaria sordida TaxID=392033 RepID=A0A815HCZ9_9BILA|nr:unnamed protein product [Rotaria sordida]